jgi:alkanesulfonate monooxygenase SsuD/methylene tetrahydromethanopterin reductase-like flavin-dependent oxidoreductase (luciferase family)
MVAKSAITVDHLSDGRLNLGLGAGGDAQGDYDMLGMEPRSAAERVARFREFVELVDVLLRNEESRYGGRYYRAPKAVSLPRPVQQPRPPILIGGTGKKMIGIAARFADVFNHTRDYFGQPPSELLDAFPKRNALLDEACERAGRDAASIVRSMLVEPRPNPWASVDAFTATVERFHAVGIDDFVFNWPWDDERESVKVMQRVAQDVIPGLRR